MFSSQDQNTKHKTKFRCLAENQNHPLLIYHSIASNHTVNLYPQFDLKQPQVVASRTRLRRVCECLAYLLSSPPMIYRWDTCEQCRQSNDISHRGQYVNLVCEHQWNSLVTIGCYSVEKNIIFRACSRFSDTCQR